MRFLQDQSGGSVQDQLADAIAWAVAQDADLDELRKRVRADGDEDALVSIAALPPFARKCFADRMALMVLLEQAMQERDEYKASLDRFNEALRG